MEEFLPRTQIIRPLDDDLVSTQSIGLLDNQVGQFTLLHIDIERYRVPRLYIDTISHQ